MSVLRRVVACVLLFPFLVPSQEVDEPAPNFIVVYDLQSGTLFKKWKPGVNIISIAISSAGSCVIVGLEDSKLMAYDLITGAGQHLNFYHEYECTLR